MNEEFRRRTKTQAMLPREDAVLVLLFGLLMSGQIRSRSHGDHYGITHGLMMPELFHTLTDTT